MKVLMKTKAYELKNGVLTGLSGFRDWVLMKDTKYVRRTKRGKAKT